MVSGQHPVQHPKQAVADVLLGDRYCALPPALQWCASVVPDVGHG